MNIPDFSCADTFRAALQSVSPVFTGSLNKSGLLVYAGTKTLKLLRKIAK